MKRCDVEVDEQSDFVRRQFQISHQLGLVNRYELGNRFHFDDHRIRDDEIEDVAALDDNALIANRDSNLLAKRHSSQSQFAT